MPKFIIHWSIGYGSDDYDIVDAKDALDANRQAYDRWLDNADQDYGSMPYSDELFDRKELGTFYGLERPAPEEPEYG